VHHEVQLLIVFHFSLTEYLEGTETSSATKVFTFTLPKHCPSTLVLLSQEDAEVHYTVRSGVCLQFAYRKVLNGYFFFWRVVEDKDLSSWKQCSHHSAFLSLCLFTVDNDKQRNSKSNFFLKEERKFHNILEEVLPFHVSQLQICYLSR
jgi:hypothetical protein